MKTIEEKKTKEQIENMKESNYDVASKYAKSKGYNDINELTNNIKEKISSNDTVEKNIGLKIAQETITDLAMLILYQEIYETNLPSEYDLVDMTNDGYIENGNAKEYIADLITGTTTFKPDMFNPDKQTVKKLEKYILQMYDAGGTLNPKAHQFKKSQTLIESEWVPYFLSGKLQDYMNKLRSHLYKAFKIFRYNLLCKMITESTPNKIINGKAPNMFDALVNEVIPNINKMKQLNSEYNYQDSKFLYTSDMSDIIVIMSNKNKTLIENGIKTQLFNANLLGADGKTLSPSNIVCLGNKINMTDEDTIVSDSGVEWVDDNTIYVLDISRIKTCFQINKSASQFYANNITTLIVSHIWFVMDILPWCKFFKYTNSNLSVLPNADNQLSGK